MSRFPHAFLLAALASAVALADEPAAPRYNSVSLQASAQRELPNDLLSATLTVEVNDATPAAVANAIYDAVGARIFELPLSAEKILLALQESGKGQ